MENNKKYFDCQDIYKNTLPVGAFFLQRAAINKVKNKLMKPSTKTTTVKTRGFLYKEISNVLSDAK